jgi:hypothetical protein
MKNHHESIKSAFQGKLLAKSHGLQPVVTATPSHPPMLKSPWGESEPLTLVASYKHRFDTYLWATVYYNPVKDSYVTWTYNESDKGHNGGGYDLDHASAVKWLAEQMERW